eukprot:TRINITY_DN4986_c0_g1_i3.p1 TRINITY_DN4986_c0_g1~~TRINITY_DN4986_c0_g1_i3.p1  ORF type:complete len:753 (-),score=119.47 TRINITY_DN4986_c0_g1_i3:2053-4311(-)
MSICPTSGGYGFGWFYLYISTFDGLAEFTVTWDTVDAPLCANTPETPEELLPPLDADYFLLENNKPWKGTIDDGEWITFTFNIYERCTNFSFSAVGAFPQVSDMDIYFSYTMKSFTFTNADSLATDNGDDSLVMMNICSSSGESTWSVFLGVYLWRGDQVEIVVTATTDTGFVTRPVTAVSANQYFYSFTSGYAYLTCGKERFYCLWASYQGNMDPYDVAHSCGRFGILPPHQEAEPWSMPLYTVFPSPFPAVLPLSSDEILRGDSNIPKRMNFYWLRQVTSLDSSRKYSNGEPETCSITLQPKLVNNIGENFHSRVSGFVRKHPHCNHTAIEETKKEFSSIISKMQRSVHVDELVLYQLKISSLMNSDLVLGCKDLLESLLVMNETSYTFEHEQGCNGNEFSPTWDSDPCCNLDLEWEMCCAQDVVFTAPTIESVDYPATSKCHLSECAEIALENYKTTGNVNARETGCSAVWEKSIRDVVYEPQLIFDCATKLWGPFDMEGVSCTSNDDCFYGAECDLVHEKCVHDQTHFLSCISLSKVRIIGQLLANHWDMEVLATYEMFVMEVYKRFIKPMCTGPGSTAFRPHYDYLPLGNNICEDPCTEENIIISCLSTDEVSCPKDDVCPPFDFTWCARSFTFVNETRNSECLEEKYCNWMACGNLDQSECEEACLSNMEPMCLDCSSTPCTPLIGWDQSRCERGLCVEDPELDDSEFCKTQLGDCSLPCPDCNKSQCEALHMCDGIIEYMLFFGA